MSGIRFHEEGGSISSKLINLITKWLPAFMAKHGVDSYEFNVVLLSDQEMLDLNKEMLDHDYYTDIITVPVDHPEFDCCGDLYLSVDRIHENAGAFGNGSFEDEFLRVCAHGILHLLGFDDKSDSDQSEMRKQEEKALELFRSI